jgi:OOP family OmpA-OmpF porin
VRALAFVAVGSLASVITPARAEPRAEPQLEASGFVGVDWFSKHTELGNSWAPEQVPGTAPLVGARVSWLVLPGLSPSVALAIEGELGIAPAFTGAHPAAGGSGGRMAYFAPVFEWHAHALVRLTRWHALEPHLVLGGGGETVASTSPFMSKETDPVAYWGAGFIMPALSTWYVRLDGRHGLMPARSGGVTSTLEIAFGLGTTFGLPGPRPAHRVAAAAPPPPPEQPVVDDTDTDGDGLPDRLDACPTERETVNGIADDDGCPEPDPDGDGILGDADKCPDQAEDFDGWQDEDGCPEPDNDGDGIDDHRDACPGQAETVNGFQDDDGCPDQLPPDITSALATTLRFEAGRARVTGPAGAALRPVLAMLQHYPELHLAIVGHPDRAGNDDLAKRRADAVKWFLVDQGVAEDRITTSVDAAANAPTIAFQLAVVHL